MIRKLRYKDWENKIDVLTTEVTVNKNRNYEASFATQW